MNKKVFSVLKAVAACVLALFMMSGLTACGKVNLLEENIIDDKYDNYYEILVYSYNDTNGDGYGDLNGVTEKLDYIRDLGYTGIWLMPINNSASYHGYDVVDYYSVKPIYGTLEDYGKLIEAAHERGIKVIIDLVVNHSSSVHPWFKDALAYKNGQGGSDKYVDYYNWSSNGRDGYHQSGKVWYESRFDASMPDLNLANDKVKAEIENIIKFWLDLGTDGFRLDGCLYYFDSQQLSIDFCKWIKDTAVKYNDKAYIVGETWSSRSVIADFYQSGCDSFFYFPASYAAGGADCPISSAITLGSADEYWPSVKTLISVAGENIPAPFLSNHDIGRAAGYAGRDEDKVKFAYGLLSMYTGNTFTYYGDEIGMIGSQTDQDKRIGMLWDNKQTNITNPPPGTQHQDYVFDGVKEQLKDSGSILNYFKVCNNARNAFPALMRGTPSRIAYDDYNILVFQKTYKDQTIKIVINFGKDKKTVNGIEGTLAQGICVDGKIKQSGSSLTMPKYSIAILT